MTVRDDNPVPHTTRRLRIDEYLASRPAASPLDEARAHSGRRVVALSVLAILVLWGSLYLAFRDWRSRYRARAAFGATQVAPAIDPLARIVPEGVDPAAWRLAVSETHRMLVTVTAANLLDLPQMHLLRAEVVARVARARPATARAELAGLWDDLAARAGPISSGERHPRPKLLPPLRRVSQ